MLVPLPPSPAKEHKEARHRSKGGEVLSRREKEFLSRRQRRKGKRGTGEPSRRALDY
jgi:hypothetical protein